MQSHAIMFGTDPFIKYHDMTLVSTSSFGVIGCVLLSHTRPTYVHMDPRRVHIRTPRPGL